MKDKNETYIVDDFLYDLKKMIEETYEALFEDEEDESKKVSWKTVDLTPKSTK